MVDPITQRNHGGFLVKQKSKLTALPVLRYVCADWRGRRPMQRRRPVFAMQGESMDAAAAPPSNSVPRCAGAPRQVAPSIRSRSPSEHAAKTSSEDAQAQGAPARASWARLLKRVFDLDVEHCPNSGGAIKSLWRPYRPLSGRAAR